MTYLDKILYLYPEAQGVMYWYTHHNCCFNEDGTPKNCDMQSWENPYEGLSFENQNFEIPTQQTLDALDEDAVAYVLSVREDAIRKTSRDDKARSDLSILSGLNTERKTRPNLTLTQYLDELENMSV